MVFLVFIEVFGSVFMKNCNGMSSHVGLVFSPPCCAQCCPLYRRFCSAVIIALLFGYLIAGVSEDPNGNSYVDTSRIAEADPVTFLWVYTFPLGLYGPAVIPLLIAYLVTTVETVGDISAVFEVSGLDTTTPDYSESMQGGLTSDAICSILSGLFTT